jgi:oligoribonuclease NrnB/cAMP/cGMP phosphodiesterase (DHH superfamily)
MKVFHLSHIDLDGYSCQLITKRCFSQIEFYNSNYGKEIDQRLEQIIRDIERDIHGENLILITDLNLSMQQAKSLTKMVEESLKDIEILLLDHHKTGADCAKAYDWYHLDVNRSATKITYDYFIEKGFDIKDLEKYVDIVNSVDIWLSDSEYFELGKVYMRIVSSAKEVNRMLFSTENSKYIFSLLESAQQFIESEYPHIVLDEKVHFLKKSFFRVDEDNTLENLVSRFIVDKLSAKKEELTITYNGYKGILTYAIGNTSIIGNEFLVRNPDFHFFMDINGRKNISMRANDKVDVSMIAKKLFNGGGHANASGGRFDDFKDSFIYEDIKQQVQEVMTIGENYE